ncbi:large ribosomal subunit protein mL52 [Anabrus simplex]|uniref:large ribosomal subunit protein mL52 n=1 Tax=Anabrus simplex TaxID=316456 RepID=UPI0035A3914E
MEAVFVNMQRYCVVGRNVLMKNTISKLFSTTGVNCLDRIWRRKRGLPENPNTFGPLTNLPDFTYVDGRPTPLGSRQKKRLMKQREYAETIIRMTGEVDFAVERYERLKKEEEERRQTVLKLKLVPKGKHEL